MFQGAIGNSGDAAALAPPPKQPAQPHRAEEEEEEETGRTESERTSGGNGWLRQETLALIKVRSDMDFAFRDASAKGPLWDEVARKLGELGYHRSGKKCREKFENVYKYHKRTKEGRASKADGKTYRFFDQLEALKPNNPTPPPTTTTTTVSAAPPADFPNMSASTDTTSSDEEPSEVRRKRKRKWKDFFGRLMKEVIHKQEELQMKFLEEIEKRDRERVAREEAWRMEEMAKMNREHDLLVHERSIAGAKDAAVITFLKKITQQNPNADPKLILQQQQQLHNQQQPAAPQQHQVELPSLPPAAVVKNLVTNSGGGENSNKLAPSPSRWPKAQVYALINLRTRLDIKYKDSGPKGPLWEEISAEMMKLGYNRSAKRCKEKWENINKYYKKVKESNKKRPEDSKTCPYFHQLNALYRDKGKNNHLRLADQMEPIMAEPEQQWPLSYHQSTIHQNYENVDQNNEDDYDDEHEDEEDEGGDYEIVPNSNSSSMAAVIVTET